MLLLRLYWSTLLFWISKSIISFSKTFTLVLKTPVFISEIFNDLYIYIYLFSTWVFFHDYLRITGLQRKGEGISLAPHCHSHPLYRHLDISRVITAESSPLHIGSSRTQTENLWFPSVRF